MKIGLLKNEVVKKMVFIVTITLGGWIIFDSVRGWLVEQSWYGSYGWLFALGLLWFGMVFLDLE